MCRNCAHHHASNAEEASEGTRINLLNTDNVLLFEKPIEGRAASPVAWHLFGFPDYEALHLHLAGLEIILIDAIVPNEWVCERDHLAGVGGIGENFLITGHSRIKDDLAISTPLSPK